MRYYFIHNSTTTTKQNRQHVTVTLQLLIISILLLFDCVTPASSFPNSSASGVRRQMIQQTDNDNAKTLMMSRHHRGGALQMAESSMSASVLNGNHRQRQRQRVLVSSGADELRRSNAAHTATTTLLQKWIRAIQMRKIDASVSVAYFLSMACLGSIVVLLPTISELPPSAPMTISSLATIGGAIGKFINGFVCQTIGCSTCAVVYLLGLSCFSLAFSHATTIRTLALCGAGMEFAHSIMWTSFAVILSTHYGSDGIGLARGMTAMALSSSAASLFVKCFVGPVLLKVADWRVMAKLGAASAFVGCLVVHFMLRNVDVEKNNHDHDFKKDEQNDNQSNSFRKKKKTTVSGASEQKANTIRASLQAVVRNKLFWYAGGAQGFATLARSSDKILGVFYRDCTGVPAYLSGGLTCSVTLGLMHGLTTSRTGDFVDAPDLKHKQAFVRTRYIRTVSATLLLALLAIASNTVRSSSTSNPNILLTIVTAVSSGVLASSIAWPFYQLPAMFSMAFGANKAVFLSFVDGMGFLWSSPVWAAAGWLVQNNVLGCGWAVAWGCLAVLLGVGGVLSFKAIDGHYYAAADADA